MKKTTYRKRAPVRSITLAAAITMPLLISACGGAADVADALPAATAKASYSPFPVPIQPGQSIPNLSNSVAETSPRYAMTLPVGASVVKLEAAGGTGTPILILSDDSNFATSNSAYACVSGRVCQWAFPALTQAKTLYVQLGTRDSYSNVTLNTYVGPRPSNVIPLNIGERSPGLTSLTDQGQPIGRGQDVYFTAANVPPGAMLLAATMTDGDDKGAISATESLTDFSGMVTDHQLLTLPINAGKQYYFFPTPWQGTTSYDIPYEKYTLTFFAQ